MARHNRLSLSLKALQPGTIVVGLRYLLQPTVVQRTVLYLSTTISNTLRYSTAKKYRSPGTGVYFFSVKERVNSITYIYTVMLSRKFTQTNLGSKLGRIKTTVMFFRFPFATERAHSKIFRKKTV